MIRRVVVAFICAFLNNYLAKCKILAWLFRFSRNFVNAAGGLRPSKACQQRRCKERMRAEKCIGSLELPRADVKLHVNTSHPVGGGIFHPPIKERVSQSLCPEGLSFKHPSRSALRSNNVATLQPCEISYHRINDSANHVAPGLEIITKTKFEC